jgi:gliding motility-associated-like protein
VRFLTQPKPVFNAMAGVCLNVPAFQITGYDELSGTPGTGIFSGRGITDPGGIFNARIAGVGTHTLRYIYAAQNGCTDTATQQVAVNPLPIVNAGPDRYMLPGGVAYLSGSSSVTPLSVLWSPPDGLSNPAIMNPAAKPLADQMYYLNVTTAQGCTGVDSVFVQVLPALTIPNVFSPHLADGINDTWEIKNLELFPESVLQVYDRYGRRVHYNKGYSTPWDGKINGVLVPKGVYYYIVEPKNGEKLYTGSITLL